MKGKGEGKEIWGQLRHDRPTQIRLLENMFCSHCSKSLFAHGVGEKALCQFLLHCKSSGSTLNVKATYFRSSIGRRKFFRGSRMSICTFVSLSRNSNNQNIAWTQMYRFAGLIPLPNMKELFLLMYCFFKIPGSTLTVIFFSLWTGRRHEFKLQSGDLKQQRYIWT